MEIADFIEIKITDAGRHTDVTLIFDRDDFRVEVARLRRKYNIASPSSDFYREFYSKLADDKTLKQQFDKDIISLMRLFQLPAHFEKPIKKAVIAGVVEDYDYAKAYLERKEITPFQTKYSITVFSGTRWEDVEKVFSKFVKEVKLQNRPARDTDAEDEKLMYGYYYEPGMERLKDTKGEIFTIRSWYIRYKKHELTPLQIALQDRKVDFKEYKLIRRKLRLLEYKRDERPKYESLINYIEDMRKNIMTQLRRYRKLLGTP